MASDSDSYSNLTSDLDSSLEDASALDGESDDQDLGSVTVVVEPPQASLQATASGQPFPEHVIQVLESFYARGMRGWGKQHSADVESAAEATGLKRSQIEVIQFSQLYTCMHDCVN